MTSNEKNALIIYLNFQFNSFVEKYVNHVSEDVLQAMYDDAYRMLIDVDNTLEMDMKIKGSQLFKKNS